MPVTFLYMASVVQPRRWIGAACWRVLLYLNASAATATGGNRRRETSAFSAAVVSRRGEQRHRRDVVGGTWRAALGGKGRRLLLAVRRGIASSVDSAGAPRVAAVGALSLS